MSSSIPSLLPPSGLSEATAGRLLIVDDEEELMIALRELLSEHGYEATGVVSGQEALGILQEQEFDLLLTDLMMPGLDGIALLRAGLAIDPHLMGVVMTGQGTVQTAVEAMKSGAFDYILKPFKLGVVLPVLSRALAVRQLRMENLQLRESVAIYELNQALTSPLDLRAILHKVADAALQQCEADEASILLPTSDGTELYVAVVRGGQREHLLGQRLPIEQGIAGWVARCRTPLVLHGEVKDARFVPIRPRADLRSALSLPMLAGDQLIGVLNVNAIHRRHPFTSGRVKGLTILLNTAALTLKSAQLQVQMREAEEKYRSIFENAVEGIFQITLEGRLLSANPACARILGYASSEELLTNVPDIERRLYVDAQQWKEVQHVLEEQGIVRGVEAQFYRKDGSLMWASLSARAVRDGQGALLYHEGMIEDVTERKHAEEAVRQEGQINAALAWIGRELIATLNTSMLLDRLCQVTVEVLGCDQSSVIFWQPKERAYIPAAGCNYTEDQWEMLHALNLDSRGLTDLIGRLKKQELVEMEVSTSRESVSHALLRRLGMMTALYVGLWRGQTLIGFQIIASRQRIAFRPSQRRLVAGVAQLASLALTNTKLFEELTQANQLKTDFLATISHELRTPLNVVLGYTDLLLDGTFGALGVEQTEPLQRVKNAAYEELALVAALLDVGRLEAGQSLVEVSEIDVAEVMAELKQETEQVQKTSHLRCEWRIASALPRLCTDRAKLKVILKNLLSNALKFTEQGSVTIQAEPGKSGIVFTVTDTGIGIAPEVLPVIFEMFRQGDSSTTRCYGGAGLGLYIVKRMLELLGGTIAVESKVSHGSTFRVWTPHYPKSH